MSDRRICFIVFDDWNRFFDHFILVANDCFTPEDDIEVYNSKFRKKFHYILKVNGYFLSVFRQVLSSSAVYRELVSSTIQKWNSLLNNQDIVIKVQLIKPKADVIDLNWSKRLDELIIEQRELDHALSWLSTLGGAFSALGDSFEHCAKVAGKISVQQFGLALRLGDPTLAARCRLYMGLSLIQQGKLQAAKKLIEAQYKIGKDFKDNRLQNMCKGVWSKLQYYYKMQKSIKI